MKLQVLVNQVGYDLYGSKTAVLQSDVDIEGEFIFSLVNRVSGKTAYEGTARYFGKVYPDTMNDWNYWYWSIDFSDFSQPGAFYLNANVKKEKVKSYPFEIGDNLIWNRTVEAAFRFLSGLHYSEQNDGVLKNDLNYYDVSGGWSVGYVPGKHLRDSSKLLQGVVSAYEQNPNFFTEKERCELDYGAKWFKKAIIQYPNNGRMIGNVGEFGNAPHLTSKTGITGREITWYDKPMHVAGHYKLMCISSFVKLDRLFPGQDYLSYGKKMWEYYENGIWSDKIFDFPIVKQKYPDREINFKDDVFLDDNALLLLGDIELYKSTGNPKYLEHAEQIVDALTRIVKTKGDYWIKYSIAQWYDSIIPTSLATFATKCPESRKAENARKHATEFTDLMVEDALQSNPFGLSRYCRKWLPFTQSCSIPGLTFFADEKVPDRVNNEGKGLNPYYTWRAYQALLVQPFFKNHKKKERYDRFARAQINWILGCNPLNLCMMYGVGKRHPKIIPGLGGINFEFLGGICHGIFSRMHTDAPAPSISEQQAIYEGHQKWAGAEIITRGTGYYLQGLSLLNYSKTQ